jgi:predicted permease
MDLLRQDLRLAVRQLRRAPAFSAIVVVTLALGIGANAAIYSVVDAVLVRPLPYRYADRMVVLWNTNQTGRTYNAASPAEFYDFRDGLRAFDAVIAIRGQAMTLIGDGGEPEQLSVYQVSPNLFDALGAAPLAGRTFLPNEGAPGGEPVVALSHALWIRRFGADRKIVGRAISVGGVLRTVVGVMPAGVRFPDAPLSWLRQPGDAWIPYQPARGDSRGNQILGLLARRRADRTEAEADEDLRLVSGRLVAEYPQYYGPPAVTGWRMSAVALTDQMVGSVRPALLVLVGAVGIVLLIACVNVANLLFARGTQRQREIALRLALGASRSRVIRQLLVESTLLAAAGGGLGVALARLGVPALTRLGAEIPRLGGTRVNLGAMLFAAAVSIATGVLVGLVPGLHQSRADLRDALGEGARSTTEGRRRRRFRSALVGAEIAMALVVLVAAGLLGRSFAALERVEPGFSSAGVLTLQLHLPRSTYDSGFKVARFYQRLLPDVAVIPGAVEASAIYPVPMGGEGWSGSFDVEGRIAGSHEPAPHAEYSVAMPGYFHAMRIPLVAGREFTPDDRAAATKVAIVDEQLAAKFWPRSDPIGKRISTSGEPGDWTTVVGVVGHVYRSGPANEGEPQLYLPHQQHPERSMSLVIRTAGPPVELARSLREVVRRHDGDLPTALMQTMDGLTSAAVAPQRFNLLMVGLFAIVALVLATVGLYGVMSYLVSQRSREIGIRIALGGRPVDVRRMVVRESLAIALGGLAAGAVVSVALSRAVTTLLFGVSPLDPLTYATITLLLLGVATLAAFGPAHRAARVDPLVALRD